MKTESKTCGVCHGHGQLSPAGYGSREPVVPFSCNFCDGKGSVIIADEHAPKPELVRDLMDTADTRAADRTAAKRAVMVAMYSPHLWRQGGLDPRFFNGERDLYMEVADGMNEKPFVLFPAGDSPRNFCDELHLPLSRIRAVMDAEMLRGVANGTVIYDPFNLTRTIWRNMIALSRLTNIVCGKELVQSVLAGRFGL